MKFWQVPQGIVSGFDGETQAFPVQRSLPQGLCTSTVPAVAAWAKGQAALLPTRTPKGGLYSPSPESRNMRQTFPAPLQSAPLPLPPTMLCYVHCLGAGESRSQEWESEPMAPIWTREMGSLGPELQAGELGTTREGLVQSLGSR